MIVTKEQDQDRARSARAQQVGLFRYGLFQDALDPALSTKQRGRLVRAVAAAPHPGPFGVPVQISRANLDRWIRDYRRGGFTALVPGPRRVAAAGFTRTRPDGAPPAVFGRFEAERPNARWVGDALHGPVVDGRKAILIAFLDDHSRAVVAARWGPPPSPKSPPNSTHPKIGDIADTTTSTRPQSPRPAPRDGAFAITKHPHQQ